MSRLIQAPGIELHEIDRSQYDQTSDNSIVGTTTLMLGFADKGMDYNVNYINTMNTFVNTYGYPKSEAERYFYNGANEVLSRGGRLYCAKLPYDNEALDKFAFTTYCMQESCLIELSSPYDITTEVSFSGKSLYEFLIMPNIDIERNMFVTEDELFHFMTENGYLLKTENDESYTFNLMQYFTQEGIQLSTCQLIFCGLAQKCNFNYTQMYVLDKIFKYNSDDGVPSQLVGKYRNDSIYMLSDFNYNTESFISRYSELANELNEMITKLRRIGDFRAQIDSIGKSLSLNYFNDQLCSLYVQIQDKTDSTSEYVKWILKSYMTDERMQVSYTDIKQLDGTLTSYIEISSVTEQNEELHGTMDIQNLDALRTGDQKPDRGKIVIVDITRNKYQKDPMYSNECREYIGLLPIMTTSVNAMYFQKLIENDSFKSIEYNVVSSLANIWSNEKYRFIDEEDEISYRNCEKPNMISAVDNSERFRKYIVGFTQNFGTEEGVYEGEQTLSRTAVGYFPQIETIGGSVERDNLKNIGIVVFKMYVDSANNDRISFLPVESFVGSLDRKIKDRQGRNMFIDDIVNQNSKYINLFSNIMFSDVPNVDKYNMDKASVFLIANQNATSLGLYEKSFDKTISVERSIVNAIDRIFLNLNDPNRHRIDIVMDCGVSNIAQFIDSVHPKLRMGRYELFGKYSYLFNLTSDKSTSTWKRILNKYDDFCKNVRKDCMFIADGLRPLCLVGNEKVVRNTKSDNTIENTVLKNIHRMNGAVNSSYGSGYCDWFRSVDQSNNTSLIWLPPSINATGVYIYTDAYFNYWDAPAGLNRGVLPQNIIDVAFTPTNDEAGKIYNTNWNYAINYPMNGIVLEGQRTFQKNKTAFDRVNVRRLFLGLEKIVRYIAKFFNYEQNTPFLRSRFKDSVTNVLQSAQDRGGIIEFYVVCDDRNNTIQTIENHELHCTVAVKPRKSLEFIVLNFIATNQSANVQEIAQSEL